MFRRSRESFLARFLSSKKESLLDLEDKMMMLVSLLVAVFLINMSINIFSLAI